MSSSDHPFVLNRRAALLGLVALGGCGFAPVYGPNGAAAALRGSVMIQTPETLDGFQLRNQIEDRLGVADVARYELRVTPQIRSEDFGITSGQETTRYTLHGTAAYVLLDVETNAEMTSGTVATFTGYSATGTPVATQAAERSARDRLIISMADLVISELLIATAE